METSVMIFILILVFVILAAWAITFIVAFQNAKTLDPDEPFLKGDEGFPE